jgi:hypothetical protein
MHPFLRVFLASSFVVIPARALITGPYVSDANTLHLFHLDEAAGESASANAVAGAAGLISFNGAAAVASTTAAQPTITTALGATGAAGFGNAANLANVAHGLGLDRNTSGGFQPGNSATVVSADSFQHQDLDGSGGAFTLEALINIPDLSVKREIVSTDSSLNNRCFQFYTDADGTLKFNFIGGSGATAVATIPTTGDHAFAANQWFHVAYVFNGSTSTFYWTRLVSTSYQANALTTTGTETMMTTYSGPLVIGNEGRNESGEGLRGLIDEVRVSNIARGAGQFLFATDGSADSDGDGLADAWEITHFGNITAQNGSGDPDGDFATNLQEFASSTLHNGPLSFPDTDDDLMNDGW